MGSLFTKEMRKTHTILLPEMMEYHFDLIASAFRNAGYKMEVLDYKHDDIVKTGLKYCNNDICLPCVLIVGQLICALNNKIYDKDKCAFLIPQAGGACRASNYYFIIKKALISAGYEDFPVISLNLGGKEKHKGFKLSLKLGFSLMAGAMYGDLLQALYLQRRGIEKNSGESLNLFNKWNNKLSADIENNKSIKKRYIKKNIKEIIKEFNEIEVIANNNKTKVGIAGEIYIKCSKLGNNNLEDYLIKKDINYYMSGFTTYCIYVADTTISGFFNHHHLGLFRFINKLVVNWLNKKQKMIYKPLKENGYVFISYKEIKQRKDHIVNFECSTGDGWLVSAEVMGLVEAGYKKVLITVPFECMVSHVCSKGIVRKLSQKYKDAFIYPIEYDSSLAPVIQENRILLVLQS